MQSNYLGNLTIEAGIITIPLLQKKKKKKYWYTILKNINTTLGFILFARTHLLTSKFFIMHDIHCVSV